jgi:hypothetical protein
MPTVDPQIKGLRAPGAPGRRELMAPEVVGNAANRGGYAVSVEHG